MYPPPCKFSICFLWYAHATDPRYFHGGNCPTQRRLNFLEPWMAWSFFKKRKQKYLYAIASSGH